VTHPTVSRRRITGMYRPVARTRTIYRVSDRLHAERSVDVPGHEIATTVSAWLAELGANSSLVEDLARAVAAGDWPTARAIGEYLAVDVTVAA
jgi:hypothetical protein